MTAHNSHRHTLLFRLVNAVLKRLTRIACRVDDAQLARVPMQGPLIIIANHINFLEVPLIYTHLLPRPVTGFAKAEYWQNPLMRPLFKLWGGIPLNRGAADMRAFRLALEALEAGRIIAVAPEGTRSGDGKLQRAHAGVVILALRSKAPILPMAYYGGEDFWRNLARLRRTDFHVAVGQPFHLTVEENKVTSQARQQMADEMMYQIAALLPPAYRGVYADLSAATETYIASLPSEPRNAKKIG
jgi:1-acyl-sn-glycerol-3-phosphate acyltransferase